jgi:hypothetical protein
VDWQVELLDWQEPGLRTHSPRGGSYGVNGNAAGKVGEVWVETPKAAVSPGLTEAVPPNQLLPRVPVSGGRSIEPGGVDGEQVRRKKAEVRSTKAERSNKQEASPGQHRAGKTRVDSRLEKFGVQVSRT